MKLSAWARAGLLGMLLAVAAVTAPMAQDDGRPMSTEELMQATALDEIFTQFGPSMEASPAEQGVPMTAAMDAAWVEAAREVFGASPMHDDLAQALEDKFTPEDYAAFAAFFRSDFGIHVTETERAVTMMTPEAQFEARDIGISLAEAATGTRRAEQITEMLDLVSADIAKAMIRQSVRGMLIGMYVNGQQGDIQVPWEEIDTHLDTIMPAIEADVALTQRAMMFYAYRDLSVADLDAYLAFLRTEPARKFYAVAAYSIGEIIAERMEIFGETLARKLDQVNV